MSMVDGLDELISDCLGWIFRLVALLIIIGVLLLVALVVLTGTVYTWNLLMGALR